MVNALLPHLTECLNHSILQERYVFSVPVLLCFNEIKKFFKLLFILLKTDIDILLGIIVQVQIKGIFKNFDIFVYFS